MASVTAFAVQTPRVRLILMRVDRRGTGPFDVNIQLSSQVFAIRISPKPMRSGPIPMVPGHEIAATRLDGGAEVVEFRVGDRVGGGCYVDSCRTCENCLRGLPNYCLTVLSLTHDSGEPDLQTPTYGGYASTIVVDENYA